MVTVQERVLGVLFAIAVTVTEPFPVPLAGDAVSHEVHGLLTLQLQPAAAVTVTTWLPGQAALQPVGLIVNVPLPAAWYTVKVFPAIVILHVRVLQLVLAPAVTVTTPLPVPLVVDTVSQEVHGLLTLQLQPAAAVTVTTWLPLLAVGLQLVGLIVNVPLPAAWLTVKVFPAIAMLHVRVLQLALAWTVTVTEPLPVPLAGDTVSHEVHGLLTLQLQPAAAVTVTTWLPLLADGLQLVGLIVNVPLPAAWLTV